MAFCDIPGQASLSWCNTPPAELDLCADPRGLAVCNEHNEVTSLNLGGLGLSGGMLPTELGLVTSLTSVRGAYTLSPCVPSSRTLWPRHSTD